jgi:hypothetical protein
VALKQERRGGPPPTYSSANLFYALSVVLPHFSHMGPRSHPGITGDSLSLETSGVEQCHRCTLLMCAPDLSGSATGCDCKVTRGANRKPFACKILECSGGRKKDSSWCGSISKRIEPVSFVVAATPQPPCTGASPRDFCALFFFICTLLLY